MILCISFLKFSAVLASTQLWSALPCNQAQYHRYRYLSSGGSTPRAQTNASHRGFRFSQSRAEQSRHIGGCGFPMCWIVWRIGIWGNTYWSVREVV
ncbi:hypothetical protein BZA05DRAFT_403700 [Tricharina praecox]|uniref:uncharacterized protein n=1 Tax=Tricharina praecox TaxID=43433 RepID=UPI00222114B4|nr:uncharacterized protein BZA05DRAFT_403700 [Tricharina praecox]KAI5848322.1 hypothetical protein BZA05DRAFT_403700 [Tricharina praecox]